MHAHQWLFLYTKSTEGRGGFEQQIDVIQSHHSQSHNGLYPNFQKVLSILINTISAAVKSVLWFYQFLTVHELEYKMYQKF